MHILFSFICSMQTAKFSVLVLLLILTISSTAQIKFQKSSFEEAKEQAELEGKELFIDFRADWCKPCIEMEQETFSNEEVGDAINSKYIPIQVDVDYFAGMDIKEKYNVGVMPTILIINANGEVQQRLLGKKTASELMNALNIPFYGSDVVAADKTNKNAQDKPKKECFLKRWWRNL